MKTRASAKGGARVFLFLNGWIKKPVCTIYVFHKEKAILPALHATFYNKIGYYCKLIGIA